MKKFIPLMILALSFNCWGSDDSPTHPEDSNDPGKALTVIHWTPEDLRIPENTFYSEPHIGRIYPNSLIPIINKEIGLMVFHYLNREDRFKFMWVCQQTRKIMMKRFETFTWVRASDCVSLRRDNQHMHFGGGHQAAPQTKNYTLNLTLNPSTVPCLFVFDNEPTPVMVSQILPMLMNEPGVECVSCIGGYDVCMMGGMGVSARTALLNCRETLPYDEKFPTFSLSRGFENAYFLFKHFKGSFPGNTDKEKLVGVKRLARILTTSQDRRLINQYLASSDDAKNIFKIAIQYKEFESAESFMEFIRKLAELREVDISALNFLRTKNLVAYEKVLEEIEGGKNMSPFASAAEISGRRNADEFMGLYRCLKAIKSDAVRKAIHVVFRSWNYSASVAEQLQDSEITGVCWNLNNDDTPPEKVASVLQEAAKISGKKDIRQFIELYKALKGIESDDIRRAIHEAFSSRNDRKSVKELTDRKKVEMFKILNKYDTPAAKAACALHLPEVHLGEDEISPEVLTWAATHLDCSKRITGDVRRIMKLAANMMAHIGETDIGSFPCKRFQDVFMTVIGQFHARSKKKEIADFFCENLGVPVERFEETLEIIKSFEELMRKVRGRDYRMKKSDKIFYLKTFIQNPKTSQSIIDGFKWMDANLAKGVAMGEKDELLDLVRFCLVMKECTCPDADYKPLNQEQYAIVFNYFKNLMSDVKDADVSVIGSPLAEVYLKFFDVGGFSTANRMLAQKLSKLSSSDDQKLFLEKILAFPKNSFLRDLMNEVRNIPEN